ncbi:MAG: hypothetical protein HC788_09620 [Sphingopyxis sp.]|nr:hypothetical protein [Sphingopyxis sp.]
MNKKLGKLALHRETVARLSDLSNVNGGGPETAPCTVPIRTVAPTCQLTVCRGCVSINYSDCGCQTLLNFSCIC